MLAAATDGVGTKLEIARDDRSARHGGHRPGRDVRRRRRVHGRGAVVLPGLPRGGHGRARARGLARRGRRRGLPPRGLRAAGRRDGRASRRDARRPVRPGGVLRGRRRRGRPAWARAGAGGRRADRARLERPARERLLAGPRRPARALRPRRDARAASTGRSPTSCWSRARSTRRTCWRSRATALRPRRRPHHRRRVPREHPARAARRASGARIRRGTWPEPPIFSLVQRASGASRRRPVRHVQHGDRDGAGRRPRRMPTEVLRRNEATRPSSSAMSSRARRPIV